MLTENANLLVACKARELAAAMAESQVNVLKAQIARQKTGKKHIEEAVARSAASYEDIKKYYEVETAGLKKTCEHLEGFKLDGFASKVQKMLDKAKEEGRD